MKKLSIIISALAIGATAPALAAADPPADKPAKHTEKAKEKAKTEKPKKVKVKRQDRVNAAKTCKAARKDDPEQFEADWGKRRNAFGKCVSKTAKELAAERKASS